MKKVLVLCTGNSCRSIIAEAVLKAEFPDQLQVWSSGVAAFGTVNPTALQAIREAGLSTDGLYSKRIDELPKVDFDLVVTVCDDARENCPVFLGPGRRLHVGIEDPVGRGMEAFENAMQAVCDRLLPAVVDALDLGVKAQKD
jgi:arsenate reductase